MGPGAGVLLFFNYFMRYKQLLDQKTCGIEETCRHLR